MSMRHVPLHKSLDTTSRTPTDTRLLETPPPYNRISALAYNKGNHVQHFHFHLSSGGQYWKASPHAKQLPHIPLCIWCWLLNVTRRVRETAITDYCDTKCGSCKMSLTAITITKFTGTNYAQWATDMALHLEQMQVYGIIKGYHEKPEEPAANSTATEKASFKGWMNHHGVARLTILLGMDPRI